MKNPDSDSVRAGYGKNTLSVGFLGANIIAPVLTEAGQAEVSYDLLLNTDLPSWLFEVKSGATTIWERWNSYDAQKGFGDCEMNSFNHFSYGAVVEWMYRYMAGISADVEDAGFKHIILQPTTDTGMKYNDEERINEIYGEYESYYGKIVSQWSTVDGKITRYHTEIPANTTATLYLPLDGRLGNFVAEGVSYCGRATHNGKEMEKFELKSGVYTFTTSSTSDDFKVVEY